MTVFDEKITQKPFSARAGAAVNYLGAALSLALVAGIGVWGYKLVIRDVSGIPVVRAIVGEMRVAPQSPGGDVATHSGLSVNEVAALGEAAGPEDRLVLAPATPELAEEDLAIQPQAEAAEVRATDSPPTLENEIAVALTEVAPADGPLNAEQMLALADQIANGADPLSALADGVDIAPEVMVNGATLPEVDPSTPGVAVSLRPAIRPARQTAVSASDTDSDAVNSALAAALGGSAEVSTSAIATGTNLVQLGAFPTPDDAAKAWDVLAGNFSDYLVGKERVIQEASSGGQTFYRLRASGFAELGDARRFCAALVAGNTDCLPVVVN